MYSHVETAVSERCVFGMMSLSLDISRKQWEDRKIYGHFRSIDILSKSAQMHVSHSEVEYWIACFLYRLYFTNTLWTSRVIFSEQKKCMRTIEKIDFNSVIVPLWSSIGQSMKKNFIFCKGEKLNVLRQFL